MCQRSIKAKGSVFELYYRRKVAHLGHFQAVRAVRALRLLGYDPASLKKIEGPIASTSGVSMA
jgi:hypothetical protein